MGEGAASPSLSLSHLGLRFVLRFLSPELPNSVASFVRAHTYSVYIYVFQENSLSLYRTSTIETFVRAHTLPLCHPVQTVAGKNYQQIDPDFKWTLPKDAWPLEILNLVPAPENMTACRRGRLQCWSNGLDDERHIFSTVVACLSGFRSADRARVRELIVRGGGAVTQNLTANCTHLITRELRGDKCREAMDMTSNMLLVMSLCL